RTGRSAWCDTTTSRRATGRTDVSRPCDATPERERGAGSREQELRASPAPCSPLPAPSRDYIYCRMPTIQIKKTGEEPGAASLAVTVPVEQVREAEARATSVYQRRARLPGFRQGKAPWTPVVGDKPKPKDLVQVTIATREGDAVKDPQPYQLVLGEGRAIPEVEERIMGMLPGETVDATVRFPSDFPEEAKRGQPRDIRITLHEVKRQQLPELDDAFAREVGDFESLEALRKVVREDLEKEAEREADAQVRRDLIEQIVQANRVAAPRPLVERALAVYAQAYGIPEDRWPDFAQEFRP